MFKRATQTKAYRWVKQGVHFVLYRVLVEDVEKLPEFLNSNDTREGVVAKFKQKMDAQEAKHRSLFKRRI